MKSEIDSSGRIVFRFTRNEADKLFKIIAERINDFSPKFEGDLFYALGERREEHHQSLRMKSAARALVAPYSKKTAKSAAVAYRQAFPVAGKYKAKARGKRA